jgi:hypothetical protein
MRIIGLMIVCAAALAAQTVGGTVVNPVTQTGASGVDVRLTDNANHHYAVRTDTGGHFRIEGVVDGAYRVDCEKPGFGLCQFTSIQVTAGTDTSALHLGILPMGKIAGRVLDDQGRPVAGAMLTFSDIANQRARITEVNQSGMFAIDNLPSGAYTVMARAPERWSAPDVVEGRKMGWRYTYYPGTAFRDDAVRIAVRPGSEMSGLEIRLLAAPVYHVRGIVVGPAGDPFLNAKVAIDGASHPTTGGAFDSKWLGKTRANKRRNMISCWA